MNEIKLIVTDLDGTLLTDKKKISLYTADILRKVRKHGIFVAFAMARPKRSTAIVREMFEPDYVIANNGATIYFGDNIVQNILIDNNTAQQIINAFLMQEEIYGISIETGSELFTNYTDNSWDKEDWRSTHYDFSMGFNYPTPKISLECDDLGFVSRLTDKFPGLHMYPNAGENWVQIMDKKATKFNGIKRICEETGIDIENVAAFGNDYNDVEMIEKCGMGVAPSNAMDKAKEAAGYICGGNNDDGVAKWIEENILRKIY